jgi:hypothetical protein
MSIAKDAKFLLLVQHDDNRSAETIPYKLYDYMNLNKPIIMLIKNPEIKELCSNYADFIADCGNEHEIRSAIEVALQIIRTKGYDKLITGNCRHRRLEINQQISNILC